MSRLPGPSSMHPDDPKFEEWCKDQMDCDDGEFSDADEDFQLQSDHETDSEMSGSETESNGQNEEENSELPRNKAQYYYGRQKINTTKWSKIPPPANTRTRSHNIVMKVPGLRGPAKDLRECPKILDVWRLLFIDEMIQDMINHTNQQMQQIRMKYKDFSHPSLSDVDRTEFDAFLGLLVYTEVFKSGNENLDSLYATDRTGRDIFRCTMSKRRFENLLCCLRFDNTTDREERKRSDPTAAISNFFKKFIQNCQNNFIMGTNTCIDESLVAFRGRCHFKMYMPKKPAKCGIKIMCLTDARNSYLYNAYIYSGKGSDGATLSDHEKNFKVPTQALLTLVKPIEYTNRNVTADNWFGSLEAVTELKKRGLTFLGTLNKRKPEIPFCFLPNKSRQINTSLYGFQENITILSFVTKPNKAVILISSMHHGIVNDAESGKPEIIADYNVTKGGVDSLDRKCVNYSPSRRTRRWPMAVFYFIFNVSTINAYVIYNSYKMRTAMDRLQFLKLLAKQFTEPYLRQRYMNARIHKTLRQRIGDILGLEDAPEQSEITDERLEKKKTCYLCPRNIKRKTFYICRKCGRPICLEHVKKICGNCVGGRDE